MSVRERVEEILQESEQRLAFYRKRMAEIKDRLSRLSEDLKRLRELELVEVEFQGKCRKLLDELG